MSSIPKAHKKLTKEQEAVLLHKATEAPFTGKYLETEEQGMYKCANCGAQLFSSAAKFHSGSGWPSFDDAIPGAIKEVTDTSHGMVRTEAICANCGGHLGHVFNDGPPETTGMRYCINSLALDFDKGKGGK